LLPPELAVIVAAVVEFTGVVVTVNDPVVCPDGMVIVPGTVADPLSLFRLTVTPPGPAGEDSVTVPVAGDPPVTGFGERVTPVMVPVPGPLGLMFKVSLLLLAEVAVIKALVGLFTGVVFTVNVPLL
jgi:hypothetical protein